MSERRLNSLLWVLTLVAALAFSFANFVPSNSQASPPVDQARPHYEIERDVVDGKRVISFPRGLPHGWRCVSPADGVYFSCQWDHDDVTFDDVWQSGLPMVGPYWFDALREDVDG